MTPFRFNRVLSVCLSVSLSISHLHLPSPITHKSNPSDQPNTLPTMAGVNHNYQSSDEFRSDREKRDDLQDVNIAGPRDFDEDNHHHLHRGLKARQITMIAIGGAIGTGLIIGT